MNFTAAAHSLEAAKHNEKHLQGPEAKFLHTRKQHQRALVRFMNNYMI